MPELILSLFPGLELLDRAFREEGFCVVAGPDRLLGGDIRDFHPPPARFDGVIGGSPCQSFSALANLVRAKGLEPRFGNLVPEFERVVVEAQPTWFLHENVPRAPIPKPVGYAVRDFEICNSSIEGEDGLGQEQERVRRFTFGVRGGCSCAVGLPVTCPENSLEADLCATCGHRIRAPNLLRWIPRAALRLPAQARVQAVVGDARETPVAPGGSGKPKRARVRVPATTSDSGVKYETRPERLRKHTVQGGHGATPGNRDAGIPGNRRTLAEMLRLQGLPEDFLDEQPFRMDAARKMVKNGVPLPLGRAVAHAIRLALENH